MKITKEFSFSNKKTATGSAIAVVAIAFMTGLSFVPRTANGSFDLDGLSQQVQNQDDQLKNHEARISNTENDVKDLQQNTSTAPSASRTAVPAVSSPPSTTTSGGAAATPAAPAPATVAPTVTSTKHINCSTNFTGTPEFWEGIYTTYSDGSVLMQDANGVTTTKPCHDIGGTW